MQQPSCKMPPAKVAKPSIVDDATSLDAYTAAMVTTREFIGILRMLVPLTPIIGPQIQAVIEITAVIVVKIEV